MALKINEYTISRTSATLNGEEFLDVSATDDFGVTYFSAKLLVSDLLAYITATTPFLPLAGGTMTGNIEMGTNAVRSMIDLKLKSDADAIRMINGADDHVKHILSGITTDRDITWQDKDITVAGLEDLKPFYIGVNFEVLGLTWTYVSPEAFQIDTIDNPSSITYDIKKNGSAYTLGTAIAQYDVITIDNYSAIAFLKLNCTT